MIHCRGTPRKKSQVRSAPRGGAEVRREGRACRRGVEGLKVVGGRGWGGLLKVAKGTFSHQRSGGGVGGQFREPSQEVAKVTRGTFSCSRQRWATSLQVARRGGPRSPNGQNLAVGRRLGFESREARSNTGTKPIGVGLAIRSSVISSGISPCCCDPTQRSHRTSQLTNFPTPSNATQGSPGRGEPPHHGSQRPPCDGDPPQLISPLRIPWPAETQAMPSSHKNPRRQIAVVAVELLENIDPWLDEGWEPQAEELDPLSLCVGGNSPSRELKGCDQSPRRPPSIRHCHEPPTETHREHPTVHKSSQNIFYFSLN
ncbi:hypothetical protein TIFTF001_020214 [Ficus carica]|uniref:Uncharacterized protein n=1 Tax=Ficus carica TaxID=3494 RepID=A0AA88DAU3_FICCA|nr:hypothetical protein TIFTF001_020214 [Ficus carica]